MCIGVEYFRDGESVRVYVTQRNPLIPIRLKSGRVTFLKWGARGACQGVEGDTGPGHIQTWPEGGWAALDEIRAGRWSKLDPKPAKIAVAGFAIVDEHHVRRWTQLRRGQYLQGLVAQAGRERRVYVVTIQSPGSLPGTLWPRIIIGASRG
jgi:hypothetical protein